MQTVEIRSKSRPNITPIHARRCTSFFCKLRGLMFVPAIGSNEGLVFVESKPSRINTSIHMFFMRFPLCIVWLDAQKRVVSVVHARPWRPYYAASAPSTYTLELHHSRLSDFAPGDQLAFSDAN